VGGTRGGASMSWARVALVAAVVGLGSYPVRAQELLFHQPQVFDPVAGGGTLLLDESGLPLAREIPSGPAGSLAPPVRTGGLRGTVGGQGVDNHADASVGFTYLVPFWSFRGFQLAVPDQFASQFPVFGTTGRVDSKFAYAPRVNLNYYVTDWDLDIGTSGTFLNLSGRVDRQASATNGPSGQLTASSNLTLVSATLPEFGRRFAFLDLFPKKADAKPGLVDSVIDLRIGTRYIGVDQNYTGTLLSSGVGPGTAVATRFSSQTFRGVGLTTAAVWEIPRGTSWVLFSSNRLSFIFGENRRNSSVSVTVPGQPGFSATQLDSRTVLVPVTELELGAEWGPDLAVRLREGLDPPRFTIRVAGVGQYWGGLGPLSAGTTQGFRGSDLFLVGAYVQAGFRY
jgi:hypothetical protein